MPIWLFYGPKWLKKNALKLKGKKHFDLSSKGDFISILWRLISSYIPRSCNMVAHSFAHCMRIWGSFLAWIVESHLLRWNCFSYKISADAIIILRLELAFKPNPKLHSLRTLQIGIFRILLTVSLWWLERSKVCSDRELLPSFTWGMVPITAVCRVPLIIS